MPNQRKRKKLYSDSTVQGALIRRILIHWSIFAVVTILAVTAIPALSGDQGVSYATRFAAEFQRVGITVLVILGVFLPAFVYDTIKFSNRFVGPIGRLRDSLDKLSQHKEVEPIYLRGDDFWTDIANGFNKVADIVLNRQTEQS